MEDEKIKDIVIGDRWRKCEHVKKRCLYCVGEHILTTDDIVKFVREYINIFQLEVDEKNIKMAWDEAIRILPYIRFSAHNMEDLISIIKQQRACEFKANQA